MTDIAVDLAEEMAATLWQTMPKVRLIRFARLFRICALLHGDRTAKRVRNLVHEYAVKVGWWNAHHDRT